MHTFLFKIYFITRNLVKYFSLFFIIIMLLIVFVINHLTIFCIIYNIFFHSPTVKYLINILSAKFKHASSLSKTSLTLYFSSICYIDILHLNNVIYFKLYIFFPSKLCEIVFKLYRQWSFFNIIIMCIIL